MNNLTTTAGILGAAFTASTVDVQSVGLGTVSPSAVAQLLLQKVDAFIEKNAGEIKKQKAR